MENKNLNGRKFKNIVFCRLAGPIPIFILILGGPVSGITSIKVKFIFQTPLKLTLKLTFNLPLKLDLKHPQNSQKSLKTPFKTPTRPLSVTLFKL